jgi:AraC-like DNA-binding protein
MTMFSTDAFPAAARVGAWRDHLKRVCGEFHVQAANEQSFSGALDLTRIGGLECATIAASPMRVVRDRGATESREDPVWFYILQVEGRAVMRQGGAEAVLEPGDATLIDGGRASEFVFTTAGRQLSLHLPEPLLAGPRGARPPTARAIRGRGYARLLHAQLVAAREQAAALSGEAAALVRTQLIEGVRHVTAAQHETHVEVAPLGTLERVQAAIARALHRPELGPAEIAAEVGLSVRQVQRLFQAAGTTFGDWVRRERLDRCYEDLTDARGPCRSVTDVAFRWGFRDAAHFSRAFRAQHGITAQQLRRASVPGSAARAAAAGAGTVDVGLRPV